jgi:NTE family protein
MKKKRKICLALQGGGAFGAYTWGILDRFLEDDRLVIEAISATSSGSINAVVLAHGMLEGGFQGAIVALKKIWEEISEIGSIYSPIRTNPLENLFGFNITEQACFLFYDALNRTLSPYILNPSNSNPLRALLSEKIDFEQLKSDRSVRLFLGATNVKTGQLKIFNNKEISVAAVMASSCLPNLFQAVEIDKEFYWDGGYLGNPAIFPLIYNSEVDDIIILHTNPFFRHTVPMNSSEIATRINEISFNSSLIRELRAIGFVTKLIDEDHIKDESKSLIKRKFVHSVRSDEIMHQFNMITKFKWDWDFLCHLHDLGYSAATNWLDTNFDYLGKKSTIDYNEFS